MHSPNSDRNPPDPARDSEARLLDRIGNALARVTSPAQAGERYLGDDAAVLQPGGGQLVASSDLSIAGVHFDMGFSSPADAGFRAVMAAASDIAAMGAQLRWMLISLGLPRNISGDAVYDGIIEASQELGAAVVGGDLSVAPALTIDVTVLGEIKSGPPAVLRSGANPGDLLWSTHPSGAALRGLALLRAGQDDPLGFIDEHRRPRAQLIHGMTARLAGATAMMDVSDGVALDCWRLAEASGVGIALSDSHVPLEAAFSDDAWLYESGESFSLLVATPAGVDLQAAFVNAGLALPKLIGVMTEGSGVSFRGIAVERRGYSHELG